jgi:hypothetical protein
MLGDGPVGDGDLKLRGGGGDCDVIGNGSMLLLLLCESGGRQRLMELELNNISASLFCFRFLQNVNARPRRKRRTIAPMTPPAMGPALVDEDEAFEASRVCFGEAREMPSVAEEVVVVTVIVTGPTLVLTTTGEVDVGAEVETELVEVELEVTELETEDEEEEEADVADVEIDGVAVASAGDCWTTKPSRMRGTTPVMVLVITRVCVPSGRLGDLKNVCMNCWRSPRAGWKTTGLLPSMLYEEAGDTGRSCLAGMVPNTTTLVPVKVRVALDPASVVKVSVSSKSWATDS